MGKYSRMYVSAMESLQGNPRVFLGGTCNNSTWRDQLIPMLTIGYYNPVVPDWTPECKAKELEERASCDYVLYVITPEMKAPYSIAEAVDDSNKRPDKTIFAYVFETDADRGLIMSLEAVGEMVSKNGGKFFRSLEEIANYLNSNQMGTIDAN